MREWEQAPKGFYNDDLGGVSPGPYTDWDENEVPGTAGKWWGWPLQACDCEKDRTKGLWPMGPFDSAEEAMKALEESK